MTRPGNRSLQLCSLAAVVLALQAAGPARAADGEAAFSDAMQVYEAGDFPAAEVRLQAAAADGHALARQADDTLRPETFCSRSAARLQRRASWRDVPYESD